MRFYNYLTEATDIEKLFKNTIAKVQRGKPEQIMVKIQMKMGGGVLNPVVEHIGDLTHRMTEMGWFNDWGREYVLNKAEKVHRWLTDPYGFVKEYYENIDNNARFRGEEKWKLQLAIEDLLGQYAKAHSQIPVYNRAQWLAREAAVEVGRQNWKKAVKHLEELIKLAKDRDKYIKVASSKDFKK